MKIHRFIIDNINQGENEITGEIAHQIIKVLKLKIGEKIELCDGKGISAIAEIIEINGSTSLTTSKNSVIVKKVPTLQEVGIPTASVGKNKKEVTLFCSTLKKNNFELIVQKATECGVNKIIPIITERTIKTGLNLERLKKISKEASEQSGRVDMPEISEPIKFTAILKDLKNTLNFLFSSDGESYFEIRAYSPAGELLCSARQPVQCISKNNSPSEKHFSKKNLWIGPEGGWTQKELNLAKENNFQIISLGPLTLRAETAAIIGTYLIVNS